MKKSVVLLLLAGLFAGLLSGCIRSRLVVTTEPPEGRVSFQEHYRGRAPITIPFIWYWFYKVKVEKEGYATQEDVVYLGPPPWFIMPFDFFAELLPIPIYDTHKRHYVLEPLPEEGPVAADKETTGEE